MRRQPDEEKKIDDGRAGSAIAVKGSGPVVVGASA
jgi:hypothetical protein